VKWKKFGFLKHYKRIKVEGIQINKVINQCIRTGIALRNLKWKGPLESTMEVQAEDYQKLKKLAGHSYRFTTIHDGGVIALFHSAKANILTLTGTFLLGALLFYQSLFIAEIRIEGYRSIGETELRQALEEAGVQEGAKKRGDYKAVKQKLYENFDQLTWVDISENGRLLEVSVAEAGRQEAAEENGQKPVHIVAEYSGTIERILPLQGNARVQKGDYVNKGDILISGRYRYQSSDYSKGDDYFDFYSHARGQVLAKIPVQKCWCFEKNTRKKVPTGRFVAGIYLRVGDLELDSTAKFANYKAAVKTEKTVFQVTRLLPITLKLLKVEEVTLQENPLKTAELRKVVEAEIRAYEKETLGKDEGVVNYDITYTESQGLIKADVLMEVLKEIGKEKPITIKKEKKSAKPEKNQ